MEQTIETAGKEFTGLCFVNLVDFDALWGHRRNPEGYGKEIEKFDVNLGKLLEQLKDDDLLLITADHGNDPTYTGTDHTREQVPLLAYSPSMKESGLQAVSYTHLIVPLFLEQLLVALVEIADVFVIGFVGEAAVSGVSLVNAFKR